jgi:serine protease Do
VPRGRNFTMGQGSGFFMSADGYAVTNSHVVDKAESVEVMTDDGKIYSAKVIGTDPKTDLALIKVDGRSDFRFVNFADRTSRIGDWVLAVGNPYGLGGTVTAGIVSARGRDIGAGPYDDFIQIDAPVNKGNSGGPTFDIDGNVIGVNTAIFSPSGGSVGIAFAVPADTVKSVIAQLKAKGAVTRGWLGVQIQPVTAEIADSLGLRKAEGTLVAEPQSGSPAAEAGILAGDVITSLNGETIKDARDLTRKIGAMAPGSTVKLGTLRKGDMRTLSLTLGEVPQERAARAGAEEGKMAGSETPRLGLMLAPAGKVAGAGGEGVVVTAVDPDGLAAERGLKTGDVILDVAGKTVSTAADVRKALMDARADAKRTVLIRVKSGEATKFVAVPTPPRLTGAGSRSPRPPQSAGDRALGIPRFRAGAPASSAPPVTVRSPGRGRWRVPRRPLAGVASLQGSAAAVTPPARHHRSDEDHARRHDGSDDADTMGKPRDGGNVHARPRARISG